MDTFAEVAVALAAVAVLAQQLVGDARSARTGRRLARIERKLDLVLDHLGLREDEPELREAAELARTGREIEAIKLYREATGAGLKEAKDAVDRMAA
jgi:ribosomal protein L7/L12